jgi:hypothetical protein
METITVALRVLCSIIVLGQAVIAGVILVRRYSPRVVMLLTALISH